MFKVMIAGLTTAMLAISPAFAQDAYMSPMDFSAQTQTLTSSAIDNIVVGDVARADTGRNRARAVPSPDRRARDFSIDARASDTRFPFSSTPASQKQALDAYLARAMRSNPKEVGSISAELRKRNISREIEVEFGRYGLDPRDAADIMAAFLMVGWEAINGRDANRAQARGIRRQVAGNLSRDPALRDPATRLRFAEELKITTYIVAVGMNAAKRDGQVADYRRLLGAFYRKQTGRDMGGLRLTPSGFSG